MFQQLKALYQHLSWKQRIGIAAAIIGVVGGLFALQYWNRERGFVPLYSDLAPEDAGAITAELESAQVDYRLADGGSTILVQQDQVAQRRIDMAAAGLPHSGRIGYELFDQANFGASEFTEQMNYHRALEGELERSILALQEVNRARVHITLAKDSLYTSQREPAKASILIQLADHAKLDPQSIAAITHLAASAVPGLEPNHVTVLDTEGHLLSRPSAGGLEDGTGSAVNQATLEYQKTLEKEIQAKVAQTLDPILGPDHFRVSVSTEVDRTSGEQSEEIFDPEKSVIQSSQSTQDVPAALTAGGTPGTASNLPRPTAEPVDPAAPGIMQLARRTEATTYQTSRVVRHTKLPQGALQKLSLSILVDHELRYNDGQPVIEAPTPEKLKVIQDLVSAAVGLDTDRGDQLVVEAFPFESTLAAQPLEFDEPADSSPRGFPLPQWLVDLIGETSPMIVAGTAAGTLLLTLAGGFWFWRRRLKKGQNVEVTKALDGADQEKVSAIEAATREAQDKLAHASAEQGRKEVEALAALGISQVSTKKTDVLTKHIRTETEKDPAALAHVIRSWLNGEYQR